MEKVKSLVKKKPRSRFFAAVACLISAAAFTLSVIAVATTRWSFHELTGVEQGLFTQCLSAGADCMSIENPETWRPASAAFLIMGIILCGCGLITTALCVFGKGKKLHIVSCVLLGVAGVFAVMGCGIYCGQLDAPNHLYIKLGYSVAIGWSSSVFMLFASLLALLGDFDQH